MSGPADNDMAVEQNHNAPRALPARGLTADVAADRSGLWAERTRAKDSMNMFRLASRYWFNNYANNLSRRATRELSAFMKLLRKIRRGPGGTTARAIAEAVVPPVPEPPKQNHFENLIQMFRSPPPPPKADDDMRMDVDGEAKGNQGNDQGSGKVLMRLSLRLHANGVTTPSGGNRVEWPAFEGLRLDKWEVVKDLLLRSMGETHEDDMRKLLGDLQGTFLPVDTGIDAAFQPFEERRAGPKNQLRFTEGADTAYPRGRFYVTFQHADARRKRIEIAIGYLRVENSVLELQLPVAIGVNIFDVSLAASEADLPERRRLVMQAVFTPERRGTVVFDWGPPKRPITQASGQGVIYAPSYNFANDDGRGMCLQCPLSTRSGTSFYRVEGPGRSPLPYAYTTGIKARVDAFLETLPLFELEYNIRTFRLSPAMVQRASRIDFAVENTGPLWALYNGVPHCGRFLVQQVHLMYHVHLLKLVAYTLTLDCLRLSGAFGDDLRKDHTQHEELTRRVVHMLLMGDDKDTGSSSSSKKTLEELTSRLPTTLYDLVRQVMQLWHVAVGTFPFSAAKQSLSSVHDYIITQYGLEVLIGALAAQHYIYTTKVQGEDPDSRSKTILYPRPEGGTDIGQRISRALWYEVRSCLSSNQIEGSILACLIERAGLLGHAASAPGRPGAPVRAGGSKAAADLHHVRDMLASDKTMDLQCAELNAVLGINELVFSFDLGRAVSKVLPYWRAVQRLYLHTDRFFGDAGREASSVPAPDAYRFAPTDTDVLEAFECQECLINKEIREAKAEHFKSLPRPGSRQLVAKGDPLQLPIREFRNTETNLPGESDAARDLRLLKKLTIASQKIRNSVDLFYAKFANSKYTFPRGGGQFDYEQKGVQAWEEEYEGLGHASQAELQAQGSVVRLRLKFSNKVMQMRITVCGTTPASRGARDTILPPARNSTAAGPSAVAIRSSAALRAAGGGRAAVDRTLFFQSGIHLTDNEAATISAYVGRMEEFATNRDGAWNKEQLKMLSNCLWVNEWKGHDPVAIDRAIRRFLLWGAEYYEGREPSGYKKFKLLDRSNVSGEPKYGDVGFPIESRRNESLAALDEAFIRLPQRLFTNYQGHWFMQISESASINSRRGNFSELRYAGPNPRPEWTPYVLLPVQGSDTLYYWFNEEGIWAGKIDGVKDITGSISGGTHLKYISQHYGFAGFCIDPSHPTPPNFDEQIDVTGIRMLVSNSQWRLFGADGSLIDPMSTATLVENLFRPSNFWAKTDESGTSFYTFDSKYDHTRDLGMMTGRKSTQRARNGPPNTPSVECTFGGLLCMPFPPRNTYGITLRWDRKAWISYYNVSDGDQLLDIGRSAMRSVSDAFNFSANRVGGDQLPIPDLSHPKYAEASKARADGSMDVRFVGQ